MTQSASVYVNILVYLIYRVNLPRTARIRSDKCHVDEHPDCRASNQLRCGNLYFMDNVCLSRRVNETFDCNLISAFYGCLPSRTFTIQRSRDDDCADIVINATTLHLLHHHQRLPSLNLPIFGLGSSRSSLFN